VTPDLAAKVKKWFETSSRQKKITLAVTAFSVIATGLLLMLSGGADTQTDPLGSTSLYFVGVFVKLTGVLLLIVGSAVVLKRWQRSHPAGGSHRQMQLVETVRLSPKQALHLINVGGQQFLVGATDQAIALIAEVEADPKDQTLPEFQSQPALDFGSLVRSFNSSAPAVFMKGKE
jgi:flagellar biosynthetic protein FliO